MAIAKAVFQPFGGAVHSSEVSDLLQAEGMDKVLIASAFVNRAGVEALSNALKGRDTTVYVGIRNGATTLQGIHALNQLQAMVHTVDTGKIARIFHPKLYMSYCESRAHVLIGSANLTHAGLHNNIEIGTYLELDRSDAGDAAFVDSLLTRFNSLRNDYPQHCAQVHTVRQLINLMRSGLIEDERNPRRAATGTSAISDGTSSRITIDPIDLPFVLPTKRKVKKKSATGASIKRKALRAVAPPPPAYGPLMWEKPNLPKGDLQLLTQGHSSGVLRLTKAGFRVGEDLIDQTKYFRYTVFSDLDWLPDPDEPDKERAFADFSLVVRGVHVQQFKLKLTHNPNWEAGQNNYTTGLHWGPAKQYISENSLIGSALRLYGRTKTSPFVIEID